MSRSSHAFHKARSGQLASHTSQQGREHAEMIPMIDFRFTYTDAAGAVVRQTSMQCASDAEAIRRASETMRDKYAVLEILAGERVVHRQAASATPSRMAERMEAPVGAFTGGKAASSEPTPPDRR